VPKDWTIEDPDVIVGYETNGKPTELMHGVSRYKDAACGEPPPGQATRRR
jgi:hypothetical protein